MKDQKLYSVTVYGTFSKDILVYAESEDDAIDYAQDICDNTNLITFDKKDLVDVSAEDAIDLEDDGCDHDCENCPVASYWPDHKGDIKETEPAEKRAPLLHVPTQNLRKKSPSQQEADDGEDPQRKRFLWLLRNLIFQYYDFCESFDELQDTVDALLDEHFQQSMPD